MSAPVAVAVTPRLASDGGRVRSFEVVVERGMDWYTVRLVAAPGATLVTRSARTRTGGQTSRGAEIESVAIDAIDNGKLFARVS